MKLFEIMSDINYKLIQGENRDIKNITIDSRSVGKGSLFFCIKGFKSDGHRFISQAFKDGAVAVVIDILQESYPQDLTVIQVSDAREALAYCAASYFGHPSRSFDLIGVTGTNGKTSTTYFMEAILSQHEKKTGIIGTVETKIGNEPLNIHFLTSTTPDTIELHKIFKEMKDKNVEAVSMEVTSHALALKKVVGIKFKAAIFTNLTQDHLDMHKTMEEYGNTKKILFENCETGIFNVDDPSANIMMKDLKCNIITYGIDNECDLQAKSVNFTKNGVEFSLKIKDNEEHFFIPVRGGFTVYNALGAIGAAIALDIPIESVKKGLKNMKGVPGRIQSVPNNKGFDVIVDYAHTPDGLENILKAVKEITPGHIITIFGCGGDRDKTKRPIMGNIAGKYSDFCIITSDNPRTEEPQAILDEIEPGTTKSGCLYEKIIDRKQAIQKGVSMAKQGDTVVIAGKGHETYQIFKEQTIHFDDWEIAAEVLSSL